VAPDGSEKLPFVRDVLESCSVDALPCMRASAEDSRDALSDLESEIFRAETIMALKVPSMPQLEYGDCYKFVASAGMALVAGAVAVPWLFLREPFDLTIASSKLQTLPP